jgi:transcriptional regulator with XRE-family HTH domain
MKTKHPIYTNDEEPIRKVLACLRQNAGLTQAKLAERLSFTPSRLSRLESGDIELSKEEAEQMANQIGTKEARDYVQYLSNVWRITEQPRFRHISRKHLWNAEKALQRLEKLENDPELKNAFLQQIRSCRMALERTARQLGSTEHPVAFMGPPEVGKTTVICTAAELRRAHGDRSLNEQMALQTGGGRVTISEVHVRNGSEYSISVDPYSLEDVQQFVSEFCDDLLPNLARGENQTLEGYGISAEVERAIRNMSGLTVKRTKMPDGQTRRDDSAQELAKAFPKKEDLLAQVLTRMNLPRRIKTSTTLPHDSTISGLDWLSKTAAEINNGRHADFSLPRRVEITVPNRILGTDYLDIRLIDTRGVDEPSAPRQDLQAYLDDERCVVVLCSKFGDAPTAATLAIIGRANDGGLKEALIGRGLLLVLPRDRDDVNLRDSNTGEWVSSAQEGRDNKLDHIRTTMSHCGFQDLPVRFLNVQSEEDCAELRKAIAEKVHEIRGRWEADIDRLVATIDRLIANRKTEETRAVFQAATRALRNWFSNNRELPNAKSDAHSALLREMADLRYPASLRASVNRRGNWDNFNYWHGLGFGTRRETVARSAQQLNELKILIDAAQQDSEFAPAHDFLRFFLVEVEKAATDFYKWAQDLGETAFKDQLGEDVKYWFDCRGRWGGGPGYRDQIKTWTEEWFDAQKRQERNLFIDAEIQKRWKRMLFDLSEQLSSQEQNTNEEWPRPASQTPPPTAA